MAVNETVDQRLLRKFSRWLHSIAGKSPRDMYGRYHIFPFPSKKKATASFSSISIFLLSSSLLWIGGMSCQITGRWRLVREIWDLIGFPIFLFLFLFLLRSEKRKGKGDWERKEGSGHIFLLFLLLLFWIESRIKRGKWKRERTPVRIFLNSFLRFFSFFGKRKDSPFF